MRKSSKVIFKFNLHVHEDRQFFSEGDSSGDDNDVDDELLPEESPVETHESFMQPEQQLLVSL